MKNWASIQLVSLLFSLTVFGAEAAKNISLPPPHSFFISHEQFLSLTNSEQKTYVKKVRELVAEMALTFPYGAEQMSARSSLFQYLWNQSVQEVLGQQGKTEFPDESISYAVTRSLHNAMDYYNAVHSAKVTNLNENDRYELAEKYRQSLYWVSAAATQTHYIQDPSIRKKTMDTMVIPASKAVLSNEPKIQKIAKSEREYTFARDEILNKALKGDMDVTRSFPVPGLKNYGESLKNPNAPPAAEPPAQSKNKVPEQKAPPAPSKEAPAPKDEAPPVNAQYYRCMYAGFVIHRDPCKAPSELPWDLNGLDSGTFVCGPGTVMCNPFIFGFTSKCDWAKILETGNEGDCWSTAKPHCVKPGLYATKNCTSLSNNDSSLQAAVELIKKNKTIFNQFGQSFADLCFKDMIDFNNYPYKRTPENIKRTKDDIKRTCQVASERMREIEERYNLVKEPQNPLKKLPSGKELMKVPQKPPTGKDLLMRKPQKGKK